MNKKVRVILMSILSLFSLLTLVACKGSSKIQGTWYAEDPTGKNSTVVITEDTLSLGGEANSYTQNGLGIKNGVRYYVIKMKDYDEYYSIIFPDKDKNISVLLQIDDTDEPLRGTMILALNKDKNPDYSDYANKYLKQKNK